MIPHLFNEHAHIVTGEFAGGPGGQYGQAFRILDQQPGRDLAGLDSPDTMK
jgi:hypothetical protein